MTQKFQYWFYFQGEGKHLSIKSLYTSILSSFIHNRQKVEIAQVSIKRRMDK